MLAGWLADVYFGRYKVLKVSMWIVWIVGVLILIIFVIEDIFDLKNTAFQTIDGVLFVFLMIGLGGFQANILQFGIDQLVDASSREISSYISWCVWTYF